MRDTRCLNLVWHSSLGWIIDVDELGCYVCYLIWSMLKIENEVVPNLMISLLLLSRLG